MLLFLEGRQEAPSVAAVKEYKCPAASRRGREMQRLLKKNVFLILESAAGAEEPMRSFCCLRVVKKKKLAKLPVVERRQDKMFCVFSQTIQPKAGFLM